MHTKLDITKSTRLLRILAAPFCFIYLHWLKIDDLEGLNDIKWPGALNSVFKLVGCVVVTCGHNCCGHNCTTLKWNMPGWFCWQIEALWSRITRLRNYGNRPTDSNTTLYEMHSWHTSWIILECVAKSSLMAARLSVPKFSSKFRRWRTNCWAKTHTWCSSKPWSFCNFQEESRNRPLSLEIWSYESQKRLMG